ncbi:hypothetical protein HDU91_001011 [Kappamyces sp. JEL0680]|nr:hypothetical protein HDU91_001011 [Kappamyces sp. JEL0680]
MTVEQKVTPFQDHVYRLTLQIPKGKVSTYKALSAALQAQGIKAAPIAVGQALKRNPFAPTVPCHRVLASNLSLGGFQGELKSMKKVTLLQEEGVEIKDWKLVDKSQVFQTFE